MTEKRKKIPAVILLILFALYWAAVNFLVSAVLVPSFMEKLDAFQRISEQSYAEQVQETEMKQNLTAMTVVGKVWGRQDGIEKVEILSEDGYRLKGVLMQTLDDRRRGISLMAAHRRQHINPRIRIAGSYCCTVTQEAKR